MSRLVLVTGGSKGLGFCVVKKHLEMGDRVYALTRRISDSLNQLMKNYPSLTVKLCDLGKTEEVEAAMNELVSSGQPLDILYNVAGIFFEDDRVPLEDTDLERCLQIYNINTLGCLRVMKYAVPVLQEGTVLINVSSESGSIADCHRSQEYGYSMSKSALNIASKIFSNQMAEKKIRVFCYHPGWMKTDMGGEGALLSTTSLTPEEAAEAITDIALHPDTIPKNVMYLDYRKQPLPW